MQYGWTSQEQERGTIAAIRSLVISGTQQKRASRTDSRGDVAAWAAGDTHGKTTVLPEPQQRIRIAQEPEDPPYA